MDDLVLRNEFPSGEYPKARIMSIWTTSLPAPEWTSTA